MEYENDRSERVKRERSERERGKFYDGKPWKEQAAGPFYPLSFFLFRFRQSKVLHLFFSFKGNSDDRQAATPLTGRRQQSTASAFPLARPLRKIVPRQEY